MWLLVPAGTLPTLHGLFGYAALVGGVFGILGYIVPDIEQRGVLDGQREAGYGLVHLLQLGTDVEDNLHSLLLGHLHIAQTDLTDVVADVQTGQQDFLIELVPAWRKGHGKGIGGMGLQLVSQLRHIRDKAVYLVIETVDLGGEAHHITEGVQIVVELLLDVVGGFHLLSYPYMAGGFQHHGSLLGFELTLGLLGIGVDHACKCGIYLSPGFRTRKQSYEEQQGKEFHSHSIRLMG